MSAARVVALAACWVVITAIGAPAVTAHPVPASNPAHESAGEPADPRIPGSYIVTLTAGDPAAVAAEYGRSAGIAVEHVYRHSVRGFSARLPDAAAARLAEDPRVASITPDRLLHITAQVTPAGIDRVDADLSSAAAGDHRGSVDADIAVIDTGIDPRHRDLNVVGGVNCVPGGPSFTDLHGHGTHVAGIAAAKDDRTGVVGVAPGARLWAVRVLTSQGSGPLSSIICGIDWVTAHADTIEVANMSLGGGGPEGSCTDGSLHQAICASVDAGVTYVVAAGNAASDARFFTPASYDEVITVSAITDFDGAPGGTGTPTCPVGTDDTFASFSNFGSDVDLTAPGMCVYSTWRLGSYNTISGTSMASPHVAGAAALYLAGHPGSTPAAVKQALQTSGTLEWTGDPDGTQEPLINVNGL